ncbi:MAG: glycosyltransferase [Rhodobacteraceae bacterium]|nr:MAG: glycosyltransferase [Paracoccaceae bacterium]
MPAPAITIILPCHNLAAHVGVAIGSLQTQSFVDFEALVIDDGSRDDTAGVAHQAFGADPRFRLIVTAHQGLSAARNTGLDAARGEMIAFLDGDDAFAPDFLAAHHRAVTQSGAEWSACAVQLVWPDGGKCPHSAIHGAPDIKGAERWIALEDAREVARLFPSAWNKLYRRDLIGETRFIPGALFEDHPFFWTLAAKARRIRYLPEPLYHYHRGRIGQITDCADRGTFQQLDRLSEVAAIARAGGFHHITAGLSHLATRVIHERLAPASDDALQAEFTARAAQVLAREGLCWDRAGAADIAPRPAPLLDPQMRLHVRVITAPGTDPTPTLQALAAQTLPIWKISQIADLGINLSAHLLAPQDEAAWTAVLRAGDCPQPDWSALVLEGGRGAQAVIVAAQYMGGVAGHDSGLADPPTGLAAPDPAALILHRAGRETLPLAQIAALPDPIAMALIAAILASQCRHVPTPCLHLGPRPAYDLRSLADALAQNTAPPIATLPPEARAAIFAHLAQMQMSQQPSRLARLAYALRAGLARWHAGLAVPPAMTQIGPILRIALGQFRRPQ